MTHPFTFFLLALEISVISLDGFIAAAIFPAEITHHSLCPGNDSIAISSSDIYDTCNSDQDSNNFQSSFHIYNLRSRLFCL